MWLPAACSEWVTYILSVFWPMVGGVGVGAGDGEQAGKKDDEWCVKCEEIVSSGDDETPGHV